MEVKLIVFLPFSSKRLLIYWSSMALLKKPLLLFAFDELVRILFGLFSFCIDLLLLNLVLRQDAGLRLGVGTKMVYYYV